MRIELPLYRQEKDNTCALACLRMVLAAYGTHVAEAELEAQARMESRGTPIGELERLARRYGLKANIRHATVAGLRRILQAGSLPILYIDRVLFALPPGRRARHRLRDAIQHNVIPTRITARTVTFHDPLEPGVTSRTLRLFRRAYEGLGGVCVVCAKPKATEPEPGPLPKRSGGAPSSP
jgi:ABC-type bacteriocin/lantibiotic exporter with double-glycine peptidase domain